MFLFGEKIENRTFLPFLTPQKRNLVGPSETIWPLFQIWGSTSLEPQIRKSNVHCILVLSRQNLKSGIPDLRFLYNVQWKWNLKSGKWPYPPKNGQIWWPKKWKWGPPKKGFPRIHMDTDILQKNGSKLVIFGLCGPIYNLHPPYRGLPPCARFHNPDNREI